MNSRITARVNHHTRHHHGTFRLLYVMVGLVLVGAALYLVLAYGIFPSAHTASANPKTAGVSLESTIPSNSVASAQPAKPGQAMLLSSTAGTIVLTTADSNKTITLAKGQDFRVNLGNSVKWTLSFDPSSAVTKLSGVANEKYQGTYQTLSAGTITLKASGAPICTPEEACPDFIRVVTITLIVQ